MKSVWVISDNIISPLGATTQENYVRLREGKSGVALTSISGIAEKLYLGKITDVFSEDNSSSLTRFEQMAIQSAKTALQNTSIDAASSKTIFILSSTKGNIELLEQSETDERIHLHHSAKAIASVFRNKNTPIVVSNACISGVMAMLTGKYLLESGQYDHAVIIGADVLSYFIVSGFQSLKALSNEPCKPFDKNRKGINLGEAAATTILSNDSTKISKKKSIRLLGGRINNDANHISGPSRTGEELGNAIKQTMKAASLTTSDIDFISAHGTATLYNDEMEAKAFRFAEVSELPMNSLKGYFGHTLGAAGLLESIISMQSLYQNELIPSLGFDEMGVSESVNVIRELKNKEISTCLKTASGFGGCNAALIFKKETIRE